MICAKLWPDKIIIVYVTWTLNLKDLDYALMKCLQNVSLGMLDLEFGVLGIQKLGQ